MRRDKYYIPGMEATPVMKKNIERIQRWLDRLSCACEKDRWDSALIEADCLSAEVGKTREEIWSAVTGVREEKRSAFSGRQMFMVVRTASVALVIVFAASLPLAREADKPWTAATNTVNIKEDRLSWVTPEEEELLLTLRAEMSRVDMAAAETAASARRAPTTKNTAGAGGRAPSDNGAKITRAETKAANGINNEDLAALVQIGEKALRGNTPAIKVIN